MLAPTMKRSFFPSIAFGRSFSWFALLGSLASGLGCGGSPAPSTPAEASITDRGTALVEVDRSAVPAPSTLLVFGRVAKPSELFKVVEGWSGLPIPEGILGELIVEAPVGKVVDESLPLDLGVAFDTKGRSLTPGLALSVAVRSLDEARAALASSFKVTAAPNGVFRMEEQGRPDAEEDEERDRRFCGLYPAFGSPYRLVCATSNSTLEALGAYLSRTTPRNTYPDDVHVEGTLAPYQAMLNQGRGMLPGLVTGFIGMNKAENPAMAEMATAVVGDLIDFATDVDKVVIDAKISDPRADMTLTASFKSAQSLVTRMALSHPERTSPPPAAFWRLPADADGAFFHRGLDEKELANAEKLAFDVLGREMKDNGASEADAKAVTEALGHGLALAASPAVAGKGLDWDALQKSLSALKAVESEASQERKVAEARRATAQQIAGWSVFGVEAPVAKIEAVAKEMSTALARPGVAKWLKSSGQKNAITLRKTASARSASLPKGSSHYEMTVTPSPETGAGAAAAGSKAKPAPAKPTPTKVHLFLIPDGERSWAVSAVDEALAAKVGAKLTASGAEGLATRAGLEGLKQSPVGAGGFATVRGALAKSPFGVAMAGAEGFRDPFGSIGATPDRGTTPMTFGAISQAGKGPNDGAFVLKAELPKAAIKEILGSVLGVPGFSAR